MVGNRALTTRVRNARELVSMTLYLTRAPDYFKLTSTGDMFSHTPKWLTSKKHQTIGEVTKWVYENISPGTCNHCHHILVSMID